MSLTKRWLAIGTSLALGATACGGGGGGATGPATLSDPVATAAKLDTVAQPLSTPQFQSFGALATRFTPVASATSMAKVAALLVATRPELPSARGLPYARSAQKAEALRQAMPFRAAGPNGAIFPPQVLGKTYVWDPTANSGAGGYVASTRPNAPMTGVRFILYAIDPLMDKPSSPLTEIGYADLIDKSSGNTTALQVVVVGSGVTYLDYIISGTFSTTSATATVAGYVTDNKTRLDFNVSISGTESASGGTFTFTSTFDVNAKNIHIVFNITATSTISASSETIALTLHFSLAVGSETVTADGTVTVTSTSTSITTSGTITVKVNGGDFATITISNTGTTFTGAGGRTLTANERNALEKIFDVPNKIFEGLGDLLLPAEVAFGFSVP